jgi:hypothetical protein
VWQNSVFNPEPAVARVNKPFLLVEKYEEMLTKSQLLNALGGWDVKGI